MSCRIPLVLFAVATATISCRSEEDVAPETVREEVEGASPADVGPEVVAGPNEAVAAEAGNPGVKDPAGPSAAPSQIVERGVDWLVAAQHAEGGWGGGSHAHQDVRDPHAGPMDPGTTAFAAMALLRAGHTLEHGRHKGAIAKATEFMLATVEAADEEGPFITDVRGTQPQAKMGQQVDTALASQFFSRLLPEVEGSELEQRVTAALDKCLRKIESSQDSDGGWGKGGGWAPVLQTSLMNNALELGRIADRDVDVEVLDQARLYQQGLVAKSGEVSADAAAGVTLYSSASNIRGNANVARQARLLVDGAKATGTLPAKAPVDSESLQAIGVEESEASAMQDAFAQNELAKGRMFDEALLSGFGNNGGEEFLSYMLKSESLVIDGGEEWGKWNAKMHERLGKVQNDDGSWSGHHCITSPVFCTAASIACLTADRDAKLLAEVAIADVK